jgi:uncharacterized membrane protein
VKALKKIGDALNTGDEKGVIAAVAVALIIVAGVVAGYYVYHVLFQPPEGYTTIYLLDANGQAVDYPDTLIVNQNYTFNVWVENHMGKTQAFEVRVKVTNQTDTSFPSQTEARSVYTETLSDGQKWPIISTISITEKGNFIIYFELWINDQFPGQFKFTGNALSIPVAVVDQVS